MLQHRIAIINDFDDSFSYVEYKDWGTLKVWNGCRVSSPHRGHQIADDVIIIFKNYQEVYRTKHKESARETIAFLLKETDEFRDLKEYLTI